MRSPVLDSPVMNESGNTSGTGPQPCHSLLTFQRRVTDTLHAPIEVKVTYDPLDPYAVKALFSTGTAAQVEWVFARDLLADGMFGPTGIGDVRIRPCPDEPVTVLIDLSSPAGTVTFEADIADLAAFLFRTYELVPPGEERRCVDYDLEMSRLLPD